MTKQRVKASTPQITQDADEEMVSVKVPKSLLASEGETVYYIMDGEICECDLCSIVIDTKGVWVTLLSDDYIFPVRTPDPEFDDDPQDWCEKGTLISADEWGKTLFPTRERAEAYLEAEEEVER